MLPIDISGVSLVYDTPGGKVPGVKDVSIKIDASELPSDDDRSVDRRGQIE